MLEVEECEVPVVGEEYLEMSLSGAALIRSPDLRSALGALHDTLFRWMTLIRRRGSSSPLVRCDRGGSLGGGGGGGGGGEGRWSVVEGG